MCKDPILRKAGIGGGSLGHPNQVSSLRSSSFIGQSLVFSCFYAVHLASHPVNNFSISIHTLKVLARASCAPLYFAEYLVQGTESGEFMMVKCWISLVNSSGILCITSDVMLNGHHTQLSSTSVGIADPCLYTNHNLQSCALNTNHDLIPDAAISIRLVLMSLTGHSVSSLI